ncbi:MAG TPA: FtsX-like permease family protein, partial [Vicinamibacterales bacterium]|nr:FtsX-like permease family protein [Vicinamibacterales bacterium]
LAPRTARRRWTLGDALVAAQIAVTAVLLVLAALLVRSVLAAERTNVGFQVQRLAIVSMDPAMAQYSEERTRRFYEDAVARVKAIAGVESAALATRVPFSINYNRWSIWVPGRHQPGQSDTVDVTAVSPEYFRTIGVPLVDGRVFTDDDRPNTPSVAIVNETFARRYWAGQSAVGKTFRSRVSDGPEFQIVGVVGDHKVNTVGEAPTPFLHLARAQRPNTYSAVVARTRGDAGSLLRDMRRELLALEPNLVFVENQTMEAEVGATLFPIRASAWLVGVVGMIAMLLAAIGLYGVIAYSIARKTREIGIRMALGARPSAVLRQVMRHGLIVAAVGLAFGAALAAAASRLVAGALYGIGTADPVSWLSAIALLLSISALANLVPAWRAARVDPSIALRTE